MSQAEVGIFAKIFKRETVAESFGAARDCGFESVHFDLSMLLGDVLPERIPEEMVGSVRAAAEVSGLRLSSLEGVYNMAHPSPAVRADGHRRLVELINHAEALGTSIVTLCTGSRADGMWTYHPENSAEPAWRDMRSSVAAAAKAAEQRGVTLLVECEHNNVVSDARRGRRILDEISSPNLRIVLDAANIVAASELDRQDDLLRESFELLGPDIVMAHGKDRAVDGTVMPAGRGAINYPLFIELLAGISFSGVVVMHSLDEPEVPRAKSFIDALVDDAYARKSSEAE